MAVETFQTTLKTYWGAVGPTEAGDRDLHRSLAVPGPLAGQHGIHSFL